MNSSVDFDIEDIVRAYMQVIGIGPSDADIIIDDLFERWSRINFDVAKPAKPQPEFERAFAHVLREMVRAEQLLFALRHGRVPGLMPGKALPMPELTDPVLIEMQKIIVEIEDAA